jgi:MFS transporter, DHA1 family, inner membrane transport protein
MSDDSQRFGAEFPQMFAAGRLGASPSEALATGLSLSSTLGILGLVPLLIGAYVEANALSLRQAGLLITIEVGASAVTLLAIASWTHALKCSRLARIGAILASASYLVGAFHVSFELLCGYRLVSGIGIGLIGAAVNTSVARASAPERLYATGLLVYGTVLTLVLTILPMFYKAFGYWTLFVYIGISFFATAAASSGLNDADTTSDSGIPVAGKKRWLLLISPGVPSLVAGGPLLWIAFSMVWMFAERKAASIGMSSDITGFVLAATNVVGLTGSIFASRLSLRIGRSVPIAAGGLTLALSFYCIGAGAVPPIYISAMLLQGVAYYFMLPYIVRLAADLDSCGRVSILYSLAPWIAHLVSPLLGATVIMQRSFHAMGTLSAAICVVGTALALASSHSADRCGSRDTASA